MIVGESITWSSDTSPGSVERIDVRRKKDGLPAQAYEFWFRNTGSQPMTLEYGNGVLCDPVTIDAVGGDNKYSVPGGAITHFVVTGAGADDSSWEAGAVVR